jgi:hypothetical protein
LEEIALLFTPRFLDEEGEGCDDDEEEDREKAEEDSEEVEEEESSTGRFEKISMIGDSPIDKVRRLGVEGERNELISGGNNIEGSIGWLR